MTTSLLPPFLPDLEADGVAEALECLEDEVRRCGALYGLLIDRTGQIIADDIGSGAIAAAALQSLAARLVPVLLASREISRTFRSWPVRAMLEEGDRANLVAQPILDQWLLALAFPAAKPPVSTEQMTLRWLARFGPLVPKQRFSKERRTAGTIIARDSISLIFVEDGDGRDDGGASDGPERVRQDVRGDTQRWR